MILRSGEADEHLWKAERQRQANLEDQWRIASDPQYRTERELDIMAAKDGAKGYRFGTTETVYTTNGFMFGGRVSGGYTR